jgi:hypothetical protein
MASVVALAICGSRDRKRKVDAGGAIGAEPRTTVRIASMLRSQSSSAISGASIPSGEHESFYASSPLGIPG